MPTRSVTSRHAPPSALRHTRFWLGLLAGAATFALAPPDWSLLTRLLAAWNAGAVLFLVLVYAWMLRLDADRIHARYREGDPTALVILLAVTTAALASLIAIIALLATVRHVPPHERIAHVALAAATVANSWIMVATMFTLHYAKLFYSADPEHAPLRFPGSARPVFWDFIYFSFTIAAACQTSDVATLQVSVRRVVTAQTLISFLFNVSILGFAVNVSAGLLGS